MSNLNVELNKLVGSLSVFYAKLHNLHWNVTGLKFMELHKYYEEIYDEVSEDMDEVAESLLMMNISPISTLKEHLEYSIIEECSVEDAKQLKGLNIVLNDFIILKKHFEKILEIAEDENNVVISDLMTQFIVKYSKKIWILTAMLEKN